MFLKYLILAACKPRKAGSDGPKFRIPERGDFFLLGLTVINNDGCVRKSTTHTLTGLVAGTPHFYTCIRIYTTLACICTTLACKEFCFGKEVFYELIDCYYMGQQGMPQCLQLVNSSHRDKNIDTNQTHTYVSNSFHTFQHMSEERFGSQIPGLTLLVEAI